jgi:hypothetical protein
MTFEEFKAAHAAAMKKAYRYAPGTIGAAEACEALGALEDAHPAWTNAVEMEGGWQ